MKKISLILTSLVFCIAAVFVFPAKEAQANPLAVGGALYLGGAGVYVVGALGVAAVAGIIEIDSCPSCQEDIEAHALQTWASATSTAKTGLQMMVDASVSAGNSMTGLDANFNTWLSAKVDSIGAEAYNFTHKFQTKDGINYSNSYFSQVRQVSLSVSANTATAGFELYANGLQATEAWMQVQYQSAPYQAYMRITQAGQVTTNIIKPLTASAAAALAEQMRVAGTLQAQIALMAGQGLALTIGTAANPVDQTAYQNGVSSVREAWQDMQDAGLVLPTDTARPLAGNIPLTYDPVTDAYAGIDGVNVPREEITGYDYGKPHWKTLEDLAMLGLSGLGAGLYIDGWVGADSVTSTYDPATDITTSVTSGTTTNVTTGETAVTSTTTTSTGDTTGNPPVDVPPTTAPKTGEPLNPFKTKPMPIAALTGLFQLLAALIFYLIRLFTFIATLALIAPTPIDNPYFIWFTTATFQGITPYPLVQNLALFFLGFSVYRSVRRVFG